MEPFITAHETVPRKKPEHTHTYDDVYKRLLLGIRRGGYLPDFIEKLSLIEKEPYYDEARLKFENDRKFYYDERLKETFNAIYDDVNGNKTFFNIDYFLYTIKIHFNKWECSEHILNNFKWEIHLDDFTDLTKCVHWLILTDGGFAYPERKRYFKITVENDCTINIVEQLEMC